MSYLLSYYYYYYLLLSAGVDVLVFYSERVCCGACGSGTHCDHSSQKEIHPSIFENVLYHYSMCGSLLFRRACSFLKGLYPILRVRRVCVSASSDHVI